MKDRHGQSDPTVYKDKFRLILKKKRTRKKKLADICLVSNTILSQDDIPT